MPSRLHGHLWTIAPDLWSRMRPPPVPAERSWTLVVDDAARNWNVRIGGRVRHAESDTLVVVVHGLGGSSDSPYVRRAVAAVAAAGWASLRIDLRGADGLGEDLYHAALYEDLAAAIAEPALAGYRNVLALGYSLGGHLALRWALAGEPRLRAVAAVCAPLDLARSSAAIDSRGSWLYREHVLRGLKRMYRTVAARRPLSRSVADVQAVRTIRDWDQLVVVPRHGFADVDDYYARASVAPQLGAMRIPALWIGARADPMVPAGVVTPALASASAAVRVTWCERGGHVGFPADAASGVTVETAALAFFSDALRAAASGSAA